MTCMFRLSCALLDLLAVSVERLHDLVCAHKVTKKTTYCKSSKGELQALLVWVGVGWSCGELCKPFFCANFAPMPFYRLLNVVDQLPLHIFRCNGVSGGRWDADRHTHTDAHTHTRTHTDVHVWSCSQRPAVLLSRDPEDEKHRTKRKTDRDTDHLTGGFSRPTKAMSASSTDNFKSDRSSWFPLTYFLRVRLLLCACHLVHDIPVRCVSVALNSAMKKANCISIGRNLLAIIFVMLDERWRERAILVCICH